MKHISLGIMVVLGLLVRVGFAGPVYRAIELPVTSDAWTEARAISNGQIGGWIISSGHAQLWDAPNSTPIDLTPSGYANSYISAIAGGKQVGQVTEPNTGTPHAFLWSGSAASGVDLNPAGYAWATAIGADAAHQVGYAKTLTGDEHAMVWSGSAASAQDVNPAGYGASVLQGIDGNEYSGYGVPLGGTESHALLWRNGQVTDLNPAGYIRSFAQANAGSYQVGYGTPVGGANDHALVWHGSAQSVIDLTPVGMDSSTASDVAGGRIVGTVGNGAALWTGPSPNDYVDLQQFLPMKFESSNAYGIDAHGDIVGSADFGFPSVRVPVLWVPVASAIPLPAAVWPGLALLAGVFVALARRRVTSTAR